MAKAIYSNEDIITAGEQLKAASAGIPVLAWEVFQALGGKGKYDRVREIWEGHLTAHSASPMSQMEELPADVDAAIVGGLDTLGASIRQLFLSHFAGLVADHVRQLQLVHKQHSDELASQGRELEFWRNKATADEELQEDPEPKKAASRRSRKKPVADATVTKAALASTKPKPKTVAKAMPRASAAVKGGAQGDDEPAEKKSNDLVQLQLPLWT